MHGRHFEYSCSLVNLGQSPPLCKIIIVVHNNLTLVLSPPSPSETQEKPKLLQTFNLKKKGNRVLLRVY